MSAKSSHRRVEGRAGPCTPPPWRQKRIRSQCRSGPASTSVPSRVRSSPRRTRSHAGWGSAACGSASMPMPRSRSDRATTAARYPGAMGHVFRPPRPATAELHRRRAGSEPRGIPIRAQRLAGAIAHRGELQAALDDRVRDHGCLRREHRRLRNVIEQVGACRRRNQRLDHRHGLHTERKRVDTEVGDPHLPSQRMGIRATRPDSEKLSSRVLSLNIYPVRHRSRWSSRKVKPSPAPTKTVGGRNLCLNDAVCN